MESFALVIFGITSNLAQTKLLPALYDITDKGLLPANTSIIGIARSPKKQNIFVQEVLVALKQNKKEGFREETFTRFAQSLHYLDGNINDPALYNRLNDYLTALNQKGFDCRNKIFYLATYPELFSQALEQIKKANLHHQKTGWTRLMIEKPLGNDYQSAKKLNKLLLKYFTEDQIFRLDHYLGKENLQNILTFRFNNGIFEHLINKDHIDHIQITASEEQGIGKRGNYYDTVGALKDVGQNHLLQMLALATMDAPQKFTNEEITKQRMKLIKSLKPKRYIFGQYEGYSKEEGVKKASKTDTFFSLKVEIDNDRFSGVPIYMRAGKKLERSVAEIAIVFKVPESRLLKHLDWGKEPNILFYRIQPNEGIIIKTLVKKPGHGTQIEPTFMQFCYKHLSHELTDAYERLIVDAIKGDQTFFNDAQEVETQWKFVEAINRTRQKLFTYKPGGWGPKESDDLIKKDGRFWIEPSVAFCQF